MKRIALIALLAAMPGAALAHVTASPNIVEAGSRPQISFRVGHGCEGAATTALKIDIPPGVEEARPRPVAGWKLEIAKDKDGHATSVTWRGQLPDDQFEAFEIAFRAPDKGSKLTFAALQTCGAKHAEWSPTITVKPAQ
jgi:periplasmic copper chaperone A